MLTERQTQRYLDRLGYDGPLSSDVNTLDGLVYAHQCSIPFETVTLHRSARTPDLDIDGLYDKIIEKGLGGYCFELNKLFGALLESLGFAVRPVYSRAVRGREGRMPINHRGILVETDEGTYSVDVGFGGPMPAGALKLEDGSEQTIAGELFATRKLDDYWWTVERITRGTADLYDDAVPERRQVELELCTAAVEEQDFDALNHFFAQPGTLFRDHEIVNLRRPDGYLGYKDGVLTIRKDGRKETMELDRPEAIDGTLREHFGLDLSGYPLISPSSL